MMKDKNIKNSSNNINEAKATKNPVEIFQGHLKEIKNIDEPFAEAIIMAKKF
ncbi:hypothetical protein JHL18_03090 [Clostridium sp. YIM B02505]|uniref:Uncharacterized protein n=1 Tax=Clostridium yunnanense TaxID=2800325 RepID=A0ABS1EJU1_9CLOT|nr:hypothetical protein [Clostridium yunnanense]MBK1809624.1 hypothetical protein [Clostridium yunnanense]